MMHERQQQILAWLEEDGALRVDEIAERLGVSAMTIHRDLDKLSERGLIRKVHGGAMRLYDAPPPPPNQCALCHMILVQRHLVTIQIEGGHQVHACCPHCGFLLLGRYPALQSVLVRDFLYGRVLHARIAAYLAASHFVDCCAPSLVTFASLDDARRFQKGWGGEILSFDEAQNYLIEHHRHE